MEDIEILIARVEALVAENERLKMEKTLAVVEREEYKARYREAEANRDEYKAWYLQARKDAELAINHIRNQLESIKQQTADQTEGMAKEAAEKHGYDPNNRLAMIKDLTACGIRLREAKEAIDKIVPRDKP